MILHQKIPGEYRPQKQILNLYYVLQDDLFTLVRNLNVPPKWLVLFQGCVLPILQAIVMEMQMTGIQSLRGEVFQHPQNFKTNYFEKLVSWALTNKTVDLDSFRLCCAGYFGNMLIQEKWIEAASMRKVKKLDLMLWCGRGDITMPVCLRNWNQFQGDSNTSPPSNILSLEVPRDKGSTRRVVAFTFQFGYQSMHR